MTERRLNAYARPASPPLACPAGIDQASSPRGCPCVRRNLFAATRRPSRGIEREPSLPGCLPAPTLRVGRSMTGRTIPGARPTYYTATVRASCSLRAPAQHAQRKRVFLPNAHGDRWTIFGGPTPTPEGFFLRRLLERRRGSEGEFRRLRPTKKSRPVRRAPSQTIGPFSPRVRSICTPTNFSRLQETAFLRAGAPEATRRQWPTGRVPRGKGLKSMWKCATCLAAPEPGSRHLLATPCL